LTDPEESILPTALRSPWASRHLRSTLKITLSGVGGAKGKLLVEWENATASAPFTVK
jgi:hypothetical protein